jgi:serine/threonine protein kinase/Tfp pilus assembly protein PilF
MIGQTFSHYRILESLGEGGMGAVYVAEDTHLGRRVAIKFPAVIADEHHYRARFLREARAVSMLNHPNIATIYDYGETEAGQPFIVMELVKGPTLADLLHEHGLSLRRAVEIIEAVAEALSEAHAKGIVHRDIKPSNVVMSERGVPKVLDFGLAKQTEEKAAQAADPDARTLLATKTRSGAVVGTPLYLSPEQATGGTVDNRSDIFALGALLYECVAGRPAFDGENVIGIIAQVIHVNPQPPSAYNAEIPAELDRITLKALEKKPEARYQSVEELLSDLRAVKEELEEGGHVRTQRLSPPRGTGQTSALHTLSDIIQRPRLSIGFVLIGLLTLGLAVWGVAYLLRPKPHEPSQDAKRWYETGTNALRDGAYFQASKALEQAVAADDNYAPAHARLAEALMELDNLSRAQEEMLRATTLARDSSALTQMDALYVDAITASVRRDFKSAIKSYTEISQLLPHEAHVYVDLGRAHENNEDTKNAIESYIKATNLDQQYATPFLRLGILYGRQLEQASARGTFDKAEQIYQATGNVEGRAEVAFQRGALSLQLRKMDEGGAQLQEALDLARVAKSLPQQIKTMLQLVYVYQSQGKSDQAQQMANDAVNLAQANGMENLTVRGLVDLGAVFFQRKDYPQAEKYFQQALEQARRSRSERNAARASFMLGQLRIMQGKVDEGVASVEEALKFYEKGNFRQEASRALTLLARVNRLKGDYDASLRAFRKQIQLADEVGDAAGKALALEGIGFTLIRQEQYAEALENFRQNYIINKSLGDRSGVSNSLINQSNMLWQLGRYDEARAKLAEALPTASEDKSQLAEIHLINARMAMSERRFPEAQAEAQQALSAGPEAKATLCLAEAYAGKKSEGKQLCEEAVKLAAAAGDPWLLAQMKLALMQALLENGEGQNALTLALEIEDKFSGAGQLASEWHARLSAARAALRINDKMKAREYAERANDSLARLQQKWGADNYNSYLTRKDVQLSQTQLREVITASK